MNFYFEKQDAIQFGVWLYIPADKNVCGPQWFFAILFWRWDIGVMGK